MKNIKKINTSSKKKEKPFCTVESWRRKTKNGKRGKKKRKKKKRKTSSQKYI